MTSNSELIGRDDVNDLDAILAVTNTDVDEVQHTVRADADAIFTWNYERSRPALVKLYEKAKTSMWNANDLPWDTDVDQEKVARDNQNQNGIGQGMDLAGTPFEKWGDKEWTRFGVESQNWTLSQFMHGEQGALICTAQIVETVPWIDAKYYAATQVMDEARHVEVFSRYLNTKLSGHYPINAHLKMLLDDIVADSRWDMTYLGMQIMVEGLALAAFGFLHQMTTEPLLKQLLRYVMSDEARHVAFGVLSLQEYYSQLGAAEIRERQEFAFEAAVRMRDRFLQQETWERLGVDVKEAVKAMQSSPDRPIFQGLLFSKIVPNCKKLGLLDAGDGWLRERFTELGVIQFEDWVDTGEEYTQLDEVAKDRDADASLSRPMAILGEYYHVGIVVPDVEAAQARLTDLLGITWGPVLETEALDVRAFDEGGGDGRDLVVPNKLSYSTEPPYIELVLEVPGSVWECNEHSNLHHIGVWTDSLPSESAAYSELRCPLQLCGRDADGSLQQFAYHRDPLGVRIELVDVAMKPMMEEFMFKAPLA